MSLIEETLFGTRDRVATVIMRLKEFCPPEGYFLAFSGGKDSICIYRLAVMAGVKFDAHYHLTGIDHPELVRFIFREYPGVIVERPRKTMWQLIPEHKMPPTRKVRYCCEELKEGGGKGRIIVTGIRAAESPKRAKRGMFEVCQKDRTKKYLHPIIDCGITGTRASRVRWSIERCLEDFIEGMEKRGYKDATEFKPVAERLKPEFAAMIKEWWSKGGQRG